MRDLERDRRWLEEWRAHGPCLAPWAQGPMVPTHAGHRAALGAMREYMADVEALTREIETMKVEHDKTNRVLIQAMIDNDALWRARCEALGWKG